MVEISINFFNKKDYFVFDYIFCNFVLPNGNNGKNIEIVPCTIREQRKVRHYNILNTT